MSTEIEFETRKMEAGLSAASKGGQSRPIRREQSAVYRSTFIGGTQRNAVAGNALRDPVNERGALAVILARRIAKSFPCIATCYDKTGTRFSAAIYRGGSLLALR